MNNALQQLGLVPFFTQQLADPTLLDSRLARVTSVQRTITHVLGGSGPLSVELSPAVRDGSAIDRPTVGDWVILDASLSRVDQVLERKSLFKRVGAGASTDIQPIAANIDTLFIVTSCNSEFNESRLERYLALCHEAGAMPVIVLTKIDLTDDPESFVSRARGIQANVPVELVNSLDPLTLQGVRAWVDSTATVALVGSSGVGKSTLLNALAQSDLAATQEVREQDTKGRHTTTHRELHPLPSGGLLIDVPGMRELRVAEIGDAIGAVFDDIEKLATRCQFGDCQHDNEPGCAVRDAINEGALDSRRLSNFQKLQRESVLATATLAEKRSQGRGFAKMVKEAKSMKSKLRQNER